MPFFLLLSGYYFLYFALVGVYIIFMPKALTWLDFSSAEIGIIYASAPFMRFITPYIFAYITPLNHTIYKISLVATAIFSLLFDPLSGSFYSYLAINLLYGLSVGISLPFVEAIALHRLSKKDYGRARLWGSLGFMAVALILAKYIQGPGVSFASLGLLATLVMISGIMLLRFDALSEPKSDTRNSFSLASYRYFWLSVILLQISFGGFYNFFTIYETDYGFSLTTLSWLWSFGVICEIVMLYFQGPLLEKKLLNLLLISTILTVLRWALLEYFGNNLWIVYLSQSLHAFSFALYHTASINYIFKLYSDKKLAQQFYLGVGFGLGGGIGAIVAGQLYGHHLFGIEAIVAFFSLIALHIHKRRFDG